MQPEYAIPKPMPGQSPEANSTPPHRMEVRLFGGFEVQQGGIPIPRTRSRTERWLLALLLVHEGQEFQRSWLAGTLWPDTPEEQALNNLRRSLSNLRRALGDQAYRLRSPTHRTLSFDLAGAFCDVAAFDAAISRTDDASLRYALSLYRGPLVPDCNAEWILPERSRRELACQEALRRLADRAREAGDNADAAELLRRALVIEPYSEPLMRSLMEALSALNDRAGLTLAYRQFRLRLHDDLQTEPSEETRALYGHLKGRLSGGAASGTVSPSGAEGGVPRRAQLNIPWPVGELVGREPECEAVTDLVLRKRLTTLTGTGGIGKTRLALAAAIQIEKHFPDGVWFIDLAPVSDAASVVHAIARTLGVREGAQSSVIESVRAHLDGKSALLILDNCEQAVEPCAATSASLLRHLPQLTILATSRQPLGTTNEHVWQVPPLALPDSDDGSITKGGPSALLDFAGTRLFLERALEASSTFLLTERNMPAVAQICRRLEGIPLAIELAAARVRVLSVEQIAERLGKSLQLLARSDPSEPARHRTLRALIEWSYGLLSEQEKALLRGLSVFAGGCTLEAVTHVFGLDEFDAIDRLASLAAKSLVVAAPDPEGAARYRLLDTIRQYAAEKLQEAREDEPVGRGHLRYFLATAERFPQQAFPIITAERAAWLDHLGREHDNLRSALVLALESPAGAQEPHAALRLCVALAQFWFLQGHWTEGRGWVKAALARSAPAPPRIRADALTALAGLAAGQADYSEASQLYAESLELLRALGDKSGQARVLNGLGNIAYTKDEYAAANAYYSEGLELARQANDSVGVARLLGNVGGVAQRQDDYATARACYEEALPLYRARGDFSGTALALHGVACAMHAQGEYDGARHHYLQSLEIRKGLGPKNQVALLHTGLAHLAFEVGDLETARTHDEESLRLRRECGDRVGVAQALANLASIAHYGGDNAEARDLCEQSRPILEECGARRSAGFLLETMGRIEIEQGDLPRARRFLTQSLRVRLEIDHRLGAIEALEAFALLESASRRPERAAKLWAGTSALHETLAAPQSPFKRRLQDAAAHSARQTLGDPAFGQAWSDGISMSLEQAAEFALEPMGRSPSRQQTRTRGAP